MMQQWEVASPTPAKGPLYSWVTRTPGLAKPTQQERRAKWKAGETAGTKKRPPQRQSQDTPGSCT